jgi:DNA polymerase elongation subunit (family B)
MIQIIDGIDESTHFLLFGRDINGVTHSIKVINVPHHIYVAIPEGFNYSIIESQVNKIIHPDKVIDVKTMYKKGFHDYEENTRLFLCVSLSNYKAIYKTREFLKSIKLENKQHQGIYNNWDVSEDSFFHNLGISSFEWINIPSNPCTFQNITKCDTRESVLKCIYILRVDASNYSILHENILELKNTIESFEKCIKNIKPDIIFIYGETNWLGPRCGKLQYRGLLGTIVIDLKKEFKERKENKCMFDSLEDVANNENCIMEHTNATIIKELAFKLMLPGKLEGLCKASRSRITSIIKRGIPANLYMTVREEASKQGYLIKENYNKTNDSYTGAYVIEPAINYYQEQVLILDFDSMYPSVIQQYNLCPTTLSQKATSTTLTTPNHCIFEQKIRGVIPSLAQRLVSARNNSTTNEENIAFKLIANALYGQLGMPYCEFSSIPVAGSITACGRFHLFTLSKKIRLKYDVIYGDTDSIMLQPKGNDIKSIEKLANEGLGKYMHVSIDTIASKFLLLDKKEYALIDENNILVCKGICNLETSGFTSQSTRELILFCFQNKVSKQDIESFIISKVNLLPTTSIKSLCISRKIDQLDPKSKKPHQCVVFYLKTKGINLKKGDRVNYIHCINYLMLPDVLPYTEADENVKINYTYYEKELRDYTQKIIRVVLGEVKTKPVVSHEKQHEYNTKKTKLFIF